MNIFKITEQQRMHSVKTKQPRQTIEINQSALNIYTDRNHLPICLVLGLDLNMANLFHLDTLDLLSKNIYIYMCMYACR